jgi:dihydroorotate dehydrogenase
VEIRMAQRTILLTHGPSHVQTVLDGLVAWLEEHDWNSLSEMRGNMLMLQGGRG